MAEELSELASILTGNPKEADESQDANTEDTNQEIDSSATEQEPVKAPETDREAPEKAATLSVKDLAEKLDMRPQDLYGSLEIDVGGQKITLSELKDRGKDLFSAETKLAKAEEHTLTSENDLLRKNRELALATQRLGREPTATERAEADHLHQEFVSHENRATLQAIPDWSDPATQSSDVTLIGETLTEYGFSPVEISNIFDHRQVKMLRDYALLRKRLKTAGESEVRSVKNQASGSRRKSAPTNKSAKDRFKAGELTQTQAVLTAIADGATQ